MLFTNFLNFHKVKKDHSKDWYFKSNNTASSTNTHLNGSTCYDPIRTSLSRAENATVISGYALYSGYALFIYKIGRAI